MFVVVKGISKVILTLIDFIDFIVCNCRCEVLLAGS